MSEYNGPERRANSINGKEIVNEIKIDIATLETRFEERWKSHDSQADERQKATCNKMDDIRTDISTLNANFVSLDKTTVLMINTLNERITKLPCETRSNWYQSISKQIAFMWVVVSGMCLTLFLIVIKAFAR